MILDSFPHAIFDGWNDPLEEEGGGGGMALSTHPYLYGQPQAILSRQHPPPINPQDLQRYKNESLINGLQIASQLARNSEQYYDLLTRVFTATKLGFILSHDHAIVRSKGCNLIGNLCRHSDRFYAILKEVIVIPITKQEEEKFQAFRSLSPTLLDLLVHCCADPDSNTRKFASFAGK